MTYEVADQRWAMDKVGSAAGKGEVAVEEEGQFTRRRKKGLAGELSSSPSLAPLRLHALRRQGQRLTGTSRQLDPVTPNLQAARSAALSHWGEEEVTSGL
uniref:Uncharacterized protein n=1 Tax=Oryza sativa TaxID=4530 RepID=Q949F6_ORYSA|nr:putative protein [Oryza sativa]